VAEHSMKTSHLTVFTSTAPPRYMDRLVKEAIEIRLHPDNFNKNDGFNLSHT